MRQTYPRIYQGPRKERELDKLSRDNQRLPLAQEARALVHISAVEKPAAAIAPSVTEKTEEHSAKHIIATSLIWLGAILLSMSEAGIQLLDGYMQGNEDIPSYIATANKWLPIVRNLGGFVAMLGLPTIGGKAWVVYVFLFGWSVTNNLHWTHTTSTNATRAKETQLEKELLQRPDIALKKESYETSFSDKRRKEKDEKSLCDQNDGTKCIRAKKETSDAARRYEASKASYDGAMAEAKAKASQETTPIAANPSLWINTILPLIGGILIRLVSRR
jgi:hypothetical protein